MPSVSPESRRGRRHRSDSGSPERKRAKDRHSRTKESRETSPANRRPAHPKSRPRSEERSTHKNARASQEPSRKEDRGHRPDRTKEDSRERSRDKPRQEQGRASPPRHRAQADRGDRRPRFDRVRVKQEPMSEDESGRRRRFDRPERVNFKSEFGALPQDGAAPEPPPKDKPNFGLSGKLAEDTNVYNGVVVKYSEPVEARKPKKKWRLYAFKGSEELPMLPIHRQSAYLLGRERRVADIPIDHPSCSKQHAVFQFRAVSYKREDGRPGRRVRPYIIDLDSANGTFVNNGKIEPRRYVELMEKDVIKFGFSSREYVLLHEGSSADDEQDEVNEEEPAEEEAAAEQS